MRTMKWFILVIFLLVSLKIVTVGFSLISSPSDVSVAVGFGIIIALVLAWTFFLKKFFLKRGGSNLKTKSLKSLLFISFLLIGSAWSGGCAKVEPGHVGIKINFYGKDRGVDNYPLLTGMVFYNPFTSSVLEYPTFVQTAVWAKAGVKGLDEEITFNSKEGMVISGDISLSYQLNSEKIPSFYVKFRSDDLENFTHGFLRNVARDSFNDIAPKYPVDDLYGPKKEEFLKVVRERINDQVMPFGVEIQQFGFTGAPRLPVNVVEALNNKIKATQDALRVQNELVQTEAEAKKVIAEAEGKAEANRKITASLSPDLLEWRRLEISARSVERWDGKLPQFTAGNSSIPLIQLPVMETKKQ